MTINSNFLNLYESYLFAEVERRVTAFRKEQNIDDIISLSIGDVTEPLSKVVVNAMERAAKEMGDGSRFRGYGPEKSCYAYPFFLEAVQGRYQRRGVNLDEDEIFLSDGAKGDLAFLSDLFARENTVVLSDPVYPAYKDVNILAGRKIITLAATRENNFLPLPKEDMDADIIYLCSPNNPTGAAYDRGKLATWVEFAQKKGAVILFDAAYESYIQGENIPHSIFEIEGARECAIEICSFSKTAGFTGVRCGYTVVPKGLKRGGASLHKLFFRLKTTKTNGVSYISQRGAAAAYSKEGEEDILRALSLYRANARELMELFERKNIPFTGGVHAPYLWMKCKDGFENWQFFDYLLSRAHVVGTPGAGFGAAGEGYFRLSSFGARAKFQEAVKRLEQVL